MDVAILHKYWIYIYDNKTEEKKKKEGKTATNFQVVPKLFPYLTFLIYRDSKCLLSSAESPFAGRELLCFYLTIKFRKKRRFTVVATVICF